MRSSKAMTRAIIRGFALEFEGEISKGQVAESSSAVLSPDGIYRYALTRQWGPGQTVAFIGLNPSTADATENDQTINKCIEFAKRWGYERLVMLNLFALRSTDPSALAKHPHPFGPENDRHLFQGAREADRVVACWGAEPAAYARAYWVRKQLAQAGIKLWCLGTTKDGHPKHPSRLAYNTLLEVWHR